MKQKSNLQVFLELITEDWYFVVAFLGLVFVVVSIVLMATGFTERVITYVTLGGSLVATGVGVSMVIYRRWNDTRRMQSTKHVPVVVFAGKSRSDAKRLLEVAKNTIARHTGFKQFKQIESYYKMAIEDSLLITEERDLKPNDADQWQKFLERIQNGICRASDQIPGEKVYHIFIFCYGAASLAVALGAVFGTRHKVVVYQFKSGDVWEPVLDLTTNIRKVKETVNQPEHKYLQASLPSSFDRETALVLNMASHIPAEYVRNNVAAQGLSACTMVEVNNTYNANLQEKDWTPVVQELFSVYSRIHKAGPARIHLFMSIPTALAFGLGVSMGIYNHVVVYDWDRQQTYYPVFSLDKLDARL